MRIAVLSDTVMPTPTAGGHGLGRAVFNFSRCFIERGHVVALYGGEGSQLPGGRVDVHRDTGPNGEYQLARRILRKTERYDAFIDAGHAHVLAQTAGDALPGLAYFEDTASRPAPCPVYVSGVCRDIYGVDGPVVPNGIMPDEFPLYAGARAGLLWMAVNHERKGLSDAKWVAERVDMPLTEYGQGTENGPISGEDKVQALQRAAVLLFPSTCDAGPQTPLEAMACGTPCIAYYGTGAQEYVEDGVGGFVVRNREEMAARVPDALALDPARVRASVLERGYTCARQAAQLEALLMRVVQGERW